MRPTTLLASLGLLALAACGRNATEALLTPDARIATPDAALSAPDGAPLEAQDAAPVEAQDAAPLEAQDAAPLEDGGPIEVQDGGPAGDAGASADDAGASADGGGPPGDGGAVGPDAGADGGGRPDARPDAGDGGPGDAGCAQDRDCGRGGGFNVFCEVATGQCLECFLPQHCRGGQVCDVTGSHTCRSPCFGGRCPPNQVCDTANNFCVGCLTDADCDGGEVCTSARTCVECRSNADCAGRVGAPVCDTTANACVGCLADADCAGGVCDPALHACVSAPTQRGLCEPCRLDDECGGPADLCIGLNVGGTLLDRACATDCTNATCPAGFDCVDVRNGSARQCRPRYAMANPSCTAIAHLGDACPFSATDTDPGCGLSGRQDALCVLAPGGAAGVCTIGCADASDCPTGFTCTGASSTGSGVCL